MGIAGVPLLIGAGELEEIIETPEMTAIPGTKDWVIGVAAYKGGLLPVFSGDVLFRGRPYTGRAREYCIVIRRPPVFCFRTCHCNYVSTIERVRGVAWLSF